jgi:hypothetical protein
MGRFKVQRHVAVIASSAHLAAGISVAIFLSVGSLISRVFSLPGSGNRAQQPPRKQNAFCRLHNGITFCALRERE